MNKEMKASKGRLACSRVCGRARAHPVFWLQVWWLRFVEDFIDTRGRPALCKFKRARGLCPQSAVCVFIPYLQVEKSECSIANAMGLKETATLGQRKGSCSRLGLFHVNSLQPSVMSLVQLHHSFATGPSRINLAGGEHASSCDKENEGKEVSFINYIWAGSFK